MNSLSFEDDVCINWKKWKQSFKIYKIVSSSTLKLEETKAMTLLHIIGKDPTEKYNTFDHNN